MVWLRILIVAIAGFVFALIDDWPALTVISTAMIALTLLLFIWSRFALTGLSFVREMPSRSQVGEEISERILLRNRSLLGKLFIEIEDRSTLAGHLANRVVAMGPRTARQWQVTSIARQRGHHVLGPVTLRSGDPLGFFRRELRVPSVLDVLIYPLSVALPGYTPASVLQSGGGTIHRRSQVPTAAVGGVREYMTGDSINVISWTSTARAGRLMVKEFEIDPTSDAWIVLDTSAGPGQADNARYGSDNPLDWLGNELEYRVMLANSLTKRVLELGRSVGFLTNTESLTLLPPERSDRQYVRIQELLAVVQSTSVQSVAELITVASPRFRPNTALLVITSAHDPHLAGVLASLRRRRISSEVFLVESGMDEIDSDSGMSERLMASQIPVQELSRFDHPSAVLRSGGLPQSISRRTI